MAVQSAPSSSGPTLLPHSSHRTALKPPNQVRWPVNLNHLAAISLEDDSDLDRSFSDDNIGSVKLLRFLKDSDDESISAIDPPSRLRRPRSTYASLQTGQQKLLSQRVGIPVARSSSLHGTNGSQSSGGNTGIPKPPQRSRTGPTAVRPTGLRHHQSETVLVGPKQQVSSENPEDMEHIFSEANAVAQRLGGATGIRAPGAKSTSSSNPANMLRRPAVSQNTSPSSAGNQLQARSRISVPPKTLTSSNSTTSLKRASLQGAAGSRQDPRLTASPRDKDTPSIRIPGSPGSIQTTPSARKLGGLQQSPLSRPVAPNTNADGQIAKSLPPPPPIGSGTAIDPDSNRIIQELKDELEYWKAEVSVCGQERAAAETWRKQVSDLERDLGVALESLSTAEAKVIDAKSEREAIDTQIANYEKTIESLKTELGIERTQKEEVLEEATASQRQQLETLEACNRELEKKLAQAQDEIDQLELQVVPADLQDVHQSLFSATQELEEVKKRNEKLSIDLSEEKAKVAREQEDAGQLLVKLSQLQDIIANHLRDNNALKEIVRGHEKCQENAEANEILAHQQSLAQEKDQKARIEQALQEQQYQALQFQQQVQLQQTQFLQQQTEIVNLRVALEMEQKQSSLLQQRLQEEQRLRNTQFGRRVSSDGELNGSFFMVETSNGGMHPGIPMNMIASGPDAMAGALGGTMAQPIPAVGSNAMSSTAANSLMSSSFQSARSFDASSPSMLTSQFGMNQVQAAPTAALPPTGNPMISNATSSGGMVGLMGVAGAGDIEPKSSMHNRGGSGSFPGIFSAGNMNANRLSAQGDTSVSSGNNAGSNAIPTVEELTAQLQHLMKEKERLQAELSKIPISGGGPMTRRKAEVLEEQMDETVQAIGKLRYSIRMRS
ncbi:hypothetical protein BGX21_006785 [Mortierella sp. AD011]|nr:hypothetical protein BGX20_002416 [Mortierella sp. AD010]KAF9399107.1 hypothetical protein BGX21_006785 [Mortierella sp. AD011]